MAALARAAGLATHVLRPRALLPCSRAQYDCLLRAALLFCFQAASAHGRGRCCARGAAGDARRSISACACRRFCVRCVAASGWASPPVLRRRCFAPPRPPAALPCLTDSRSSRALCSQMDAPGPTQAVAARVHALHLRRRVDAALVDVDAALGGAWRVALVALVARGQASSHGSRLAFVRARCRRGGRGVVGRRAAEAAARRGARRAHPRPRGDVREAAATAARRCGGGEERACGGGAADERAAGAGGKREEGRRRCGPPLRTVCVPHRVGSCRRVVLACGPACRPVTRE